MRTQHVSKVTPSVRRISRFLTITYLVSFVLWFPAILVSLVLFGIDTAILGLTSIGLALLVLFNIGGSRDQASEDFAKRRETYTLDKRRRFRVWYPTVMQSTWYLVGASSLFLLVGLMFLALGIAFVTK
jgi:hypothetical protein